VVTLSNRIPRDTLTIVTLRGILSNGIIMGYSIKWNTKGYYINWNTNGLHYKIEYQGILYKLEY